MFGDLIRRLFGPKTPPEPRVEYQHEPPQDADAVRHYRENEHHLWFGEVDQKLELDSRLVDVPGPDMIRLIVLEKPPRGPLPDLSVPFAVGSFKDAPAGTLRHLFGLAHLEAVDVSFAKALRGVEVADLARLPRLQSLFARYCEWTDPDLAAVAGMSNLRLLNLEGNFQATDAGFAHLLRLSLLTRLSVNDCVITDAFAAQLPRLAGLRALHASRTKLTDAGVVHLGRLAELRTVTLRELPLTDAGFAPLAALPLEHLDLGRTRVTDATAELVGRMPNLKYLDVSETGVSDRGMEAIARCAALEDLTLIENPITDRGLRAIRHLPNIRRLHLSHLPLTDASAEVLAGFPKLTDLTVNYHNISKREGNRIWKLVKARGGSAWGF